MEFATLTSLLTQQYIGFKVNLDRQPKNKKKKLKARHCKIYILVSAHLLCKQWVNTFMKNI